MQKLENEMRASVKISSTFLEQHDNGPKEKEGKVSKQLIEN